MENDFIFPFDYELKVFIEKKEAGRWFHRLLTQVPQVQVEMLWMQEMPINEACRRKGCMYVLEPD